jgi:glucose-6-phosphate 1-dehydrogenase
VLATVLADPPTGGMSTWHLSKARVIEAIPPIRPEDAVRGQYRGYLDVSGVAPGSTVETYVAVRLTVDSWRWAGVPILIRAGKCLPVTATEVLVRYRRPPQNVFALDPFRSTNTLRFRVWPETAVGLTLAGKQPGRQMVPQVDKLSFAQQPGSDMRPYDRLIGAALAGDKWLFATQDTVESAWRVVDPILGDVVPLHTYDRGTWGPSEAEALLPSGDTWHNPA